MIWISIFLFLSLFLAKNKKRIGGKLLPNLRFTARTKNGQTVHRIHFFPISIPFLDGFYLMYLIRKNGMAQVDQIMNQLPPDNVYEVPVGPHVYLLSKEAAFTRTVLCSSDPAHLSRPTSHFNKYFLKALNEGLLGLPYHRWNHRRKIISQAFPSRCLQSYLKVINGHSKDLISELSLQVMGNGGNLDGEMFQKCVDNKIFKITMDFIMGPCHEICGVEETNQFYEDVLEFKELFMYRFTHLECMIPMVWWFHPKRKQLDLLSNRMHKYVEMVMKKYELRSDGERLGSINNAHTERCLVEEMVNHGAKVEEVYNEILTFLIAGHETISGALNVTLYHLACYPKYQEQCRNETDLLWETSSFEDSQWGLEMDHLSKLEHLERFIMETLRIAPTVPATGRELNAPLKINEKLTLRRGQLVLISPWIIHHDPQYYSRPEVFDPNRFLPEEVSKREKGTFLPFSMGYRDCIGRRLAMIELKALSAWILRHFDVSTPDGVQDIKFIYQLTLTTEKPFSISLKLRDKTM